MNTRRRADGRQESALTPRGCDLAAHKPCASPVGRAAWPRWLPAVCLAVTLLRIPVSTAETKTWIGTGTQDWFAADMWSSSGVPGPNDDVVISGGSVIVLLTNETASLNSFAISNTATLVSSNWHTKLRAATVTVGAGGTLTCAGPFLNETMSNRVHIVCSNLTVAAGGKIDVNEKGYAGMLGTGQGPGGGYEVTGSYPCGASHGGHGAKSSFTYGRARLPYGSVSAPLVAGSGGGGFAAYGNIGGHGGGAIRIEADGAVTVHGVISANATPDPTVYAVDKDPGWHAMVAGGSGGSIYITCRTFAGSNGSLAADGGKGNGYGGRGGGGRIAVVYAPAAQRSIQPIPALRYSVRTENVGAMEYSRLNIGTIYFPDGCILPQDIQGTLFGQVRLGVSSWSPGHLTVNDAWLALTQEGLQLTVTQDVTVIGSKGILELGGSETVIRDYMIVGNSDTELFRFSAMTASALRVGGNLILTNSAKFYVYSAPTNSTVPYGALVDVAGDVRIENNSWIFPCSHPTNTGGAPLFRMRNLTVPTSTAGFNADGRGYFGGFGSRGYGDGGGNYVGVGAGGGYGGMGGKASSGTLGGDTYGSSNAPAQPGSGGGVPNASYQTGGNGGGLITIQALKNVTLNGAIQAHGGRGGYTWGGGGSGGGIYLQCSRLAGTGRFQAGGGFGRWGWYTNPDRWIYSGSGGGGRIAVARQDDSGWSGTATAHGATNVVAEGFGGTGTVVWVSIPWQATVITLR